MKVLTAYHWGVGRETTAKMSDTIQNAKAYHWGVGRETTAFAT